MNPKNRNTAVCIFFLFFVTAIAHLLFSWMGFNPTDDGVILASSRRILEGQIPHLDFIAIRPVGSPLLHIPFVLFDGNYTYWISRLFVWFQFACIAWAWTTIISKLLKIPFNIIEKILFALIIFAFSSHNFPIMAWPTIDGLFLLSIGLVLCLRGSQGNKLVGYTLIGMAYLCKQNFLVMVPASIIILGDWRRIRFWLATVMPGIFYLGYLFFAGAIPDAVLQMTSKTDLFSVGIVRYIVQWQLPLAILLAYLIMFIAFGQNKKRILIRERNAQTLFAMIMLYGVVLLAAITLGFGQKEFFNIPSFVLFGTAVGTTMYFILGRERRTEYIRAGILVLLVAWSASISMGYNTPALGTGSLAVLLMAYSYVLCQTVNRNYWLKRLPTFLASFVTIVTIFSYGRGRVNYIYRDRPACELRYSLDGVLPGGNLIKTNINTYRFLADLGVAISKTNGQDYAIIRDLAGYWVKSAQINPLPIDWTHGEELYIKALVDRVIGELRAQRGNMVVIIQKVNAETLAQGFMPLPVHDDYVVLHYVREHFTKIDETKFFELYK